MAIFVVLATVLAVMDATHRWIQAVHRLPSAVSADRSESNPEAKRVDVQRQIPDESGPTTAALSSSGSTSAGAEYEKVWRDYRWLILINWLIVLGIHLGYWTLLAQDLVFSRKVEQIRIGALLLPGALIWAYFLTAFSSSHITSVVVFDSIYFILVLAEVGQNRDGAFRLQGANRRALIWMCIDIVLVACLTLSLIDYYLAHNFPKFYSSLPLIERAYMHMIGMKDAVIAINLLGYCFAFILSREVDRSASNIYYRGFVRYIFTPVPEAPSNTSSPHRPLEPVDGGRSLKAILSGVSIDAGAALPAVSMAARVRSLREPPSSDREGGFVIVDYGCCDSRRSIPMLECLGIQTSQIKIFVGIDQDESWKPEFERVCLFGPDAGDNQKDRYRIANQFCTTTEAAKPHLCDADILIASHIFHDEAMIESFITAARVASKAVIIVCGCAPYHFLAGPITDAAVQGFFPLPFYRWESVHLSNFVDRMGNLEPVPRGDAEDPVLSSINSSLGWGLHLSSLITMIGAFVVFALSVFSFFVWGTEVGVAGLGVGLVLMAISRYNSCPSISKVDRGEWWYTPFAVISRRLLLNEEVVCSFVQWLEFKYGYRMALRYFWRLKRYLKLIETHPNPKFLSFHDLVYVFERSEVGDHLGSSLPDSVSLEAKAGSAVAVIDPAAIAAASES